MPLRIVLLKCSSASPPMPMPSSFFGLEAFCMANPVRIQTPMLMCLYVSASGSTGAGGASGGGASAGTAAAAGGAGTAGVTTAGASATAGGAGEPATGAGGAAGAAVAGTTGAAAGAGGGGGGAACALAKPEYSEGSAVAAITRDRFAKLFPKVAFIFSPKSVSNQVLAMCCKGTHAASASAHPFTLLSMNTVFRVK